MNEAEDLEQRENRRDFNILWKNELESAFKTLACRVYLQGRVDGMKAALKDLGKSDETVQQ